MAPRRTLVEHVPERLERHAGPAAAVEHLQARAPGGRQRRLDARPHECRELRRRGAVGVVHAGTGELPEDAPLDGFVEEALRLLAGSLPCRPFSAVRIRPVQREAAVGLAMADRGGYRIEGTLRCRAVSTATPRIRGAPPLQGGLGRAYTRYSAHPGSAPGFAIAQNILRALLRASGERPPASGSLSRRFPVHCAARATGIGTGRPACGTEYARNTVEPERKEKQTNGRALAREPQHDL